MPKYKITKGSVKPLGEGVELLVTFIRDDGTESEEQRYEVASTEKEVIYAELSKTAVLFENMKATSELPTLTEDTEVSVK